MRCRRLCCSGCKGELRSSLEQIYLWIDLEELDAVGGHSCCSKAGNRWAVHCGSAGRGGRRERKGGGEGVLRL
eukprot:764984-Hanusia_phi.AAC.1